MRWQKLADKNHVIIGEAMTIYHMPIYKKLKEILETGILGKVNLITMNFGSFKEYDMNNRIFLTLILPVEQCWILEYMRFHSSAGSWIQNQISCCRR